MLAFAARYPDEVAGMALVDSTAPAAAATPPASSSDAAGSYDVMGRVSALVSAAARVATVSQLRSTIDEYIQGGSSAEQAAALDDFANKPLVVLTAGSGSDADWSAAQDEMATLSTNSAHLVVQGATHASMISDETDAAATAQAILDVVSSVRSSGLLVR